METTRPLILPMLDTDKSKLPLPSPWPALDAANLAALAWQGVNSGACGDATPSPQANAASDACKIGKTPTRVQLHLTTVRSTI